MVSVRSAMLHRSGRSVGLIGHPRSMKQIISSRRTSLVEYAASCLSVWGAEKEVSGKKNRNSLCMQVRRHGMVVMFCASCERRCCVRTAANPYSQFLTPHGSCAKKKRGFLGKIAVAQWQKFDQDAIRTREGFPTTRCIAPERSALDHSAT